MSTFFERAAEYASDQDRKWFEQHPDADRYFRPTVIGEFGPGRYPKGGRTKVAQLGPGLRARTGSAFLELEFSAQLVELPPAWAAGLDLTAPEEVPHE
ncbi:hypothetical protein [Streptomyces mirabilis]|uniref:hypothetical protein n=1 Tax=Streptomyces mirabilis TaxID=68239 RepID=UPI00225B40F1|nr:hypothetical protein [Streptomyces mirabilis]MCX4612111.1 hypothetical protein [Streptomyces mirabilis]